MANCFELPYINLSCFCPISCCLSGGMSLDKDPNVSSNDEDIKSIKAIQTQPSATKSFSSDITVVTDL